MNGEPPAWTIPRQALRMAAIAVVYVIAARVGFLYSIVGASVTLAWLPSGIALAALLRYGNRVWPGIALGAWLANAWTGVPLWSACEIAAGNTLGAVTGAFLLTRVVRFHPALDHLGDVFALGGMGACSTLVSAGIGSLSLALGGAIPWADYGWSCLVWWMGDYTGVLTATPALLARGTPLSLRPSALQVIEAAGLLAALGATSQAIFGVPELAGHGYFPAALAVFPFVIWGALRFGQQGAASVTLIAALIAILGTTHGTGPFAVPSPVDSLIRWWAFATLCALTGLLLAASSAERRRAETALRQAREELEQRVEERTRDLTRTNRELQDEMATRKRLEGEITRISEEEQKRLGQELHDGLGQHLTGVAFLSRALAQKLSSESLPESDAVQEILQLVNQAIATTQSLARALYPAVLDTGGIVSALEQLAIHTKQLYGIECDFRGDSAPGIADPLVRINLYRIAQEAIHNAVKHGKARAIEIELSALEGRYRLLVRNDGVEFDPQVLEHSRGLGQHIMRYRASLIGGSLAFQKNPKGGTLVTVSVP